ncbi:MAG TPA: hypothetical protein PLF29_03375, partial [bacterium]|nr:hypothetical protein [bacterium]
IIISMFNVFNNLTTEQGIMHTAEFFSLLFVFSITYHAIHNIKGTIKPPTKALISMFFGTVAYGIAKIIIGLFFGTY